MSICPGGDDWQLRGCLGEVALAPGDRRRVIRPAGSSARREQARSARAKMMCPLTIHADRRVTAP